MGHLRVTVCHLRVTVGHLKATVGHLKVIKGHLRVSNWSLGKRNWASPQSKANLFNSTLFHRVIELLLNLLEPRFWDCSRNHSCSLTSNSLSQKPRTKAKLSIPFQVLRHDGVFLWYFHREFLVSLNCFSFSWDYPVHTHSSLSDTLTQLGREEEGQTDGPRSSLSLLVVSFWFSVWKWL